MTGIEQLEKRIRGYLFSDVDISKDLKAKLSKENENVNIDTQIAKAKKDITPTVLANRLVPKTVIDNWYKKVNDIEVGLKVNDEIFEIEKEFNLLKDPLVIGKYNNTQILTAINYLKERADIQKRKNNTYSGNVKGFASDCEKFYIKERVQLFSFEYRDCINDIEKQISSFRVGGDFQFYQYVQLAEDTFSKYQSIYKNNTALFSDIVGIIHEICKQSKINIPTAKTVSIITCPKCDDKEQTGNICTKCNAYIKCPG